MTKKEKCKARVRGDGWHSRQCSRNAVADGYCRQHHPDAEAKRDAEFRAKPNRKSELLEAKRRLRETCSITRERALECAGYLARSRPELSMSQAFTKARESEKAARNEVRRLEDDV